MKRPIRLSISLFLAILMIVTSPPFYFVSATDFNAITSTVDASIISDSGNVISARAIAESNIISVYDAKTALVEKDGEEWAEITIEPGTYNNNSLLMKIPLHIFDFNVVDNRYMKLVYTADYDKTMDISVNPFVSPSVKAETWLKDTSNPVAKSSGESVYILDLTKLNAKTEITRDYTEFNLILKLFGSQSKTIEKTSHISIKYIAFCANEEEAKSFKPSPVTSARTDDKLTADVIAAAVKNNAKYIDVSFAGVTGSSNGNITLSKSFISEVTKKLPDASVNVSGDDAKITLSPEALSELASLSSDIEISFNADDNGVKLEALKDGKSIAMKSKVRVLLNVNAGDINAVATLDGNKAPASGNVCAMPAVNTTLPATVGYIANSYKSFSDTNGHWGNSYIRFVSARELMSGVSETDFAPNSTMTRAMAATVLVRLSGENATGAHKYTDVNPDDWFAPAVSWAYENKISDTTSDKFRPNDPITREELASFLYNSDKNANNAGTIDFKDASLISASYKDAVAYCVERKIIGGYDDGTFKPQNHASRAEVATMISRYINANLKCNEIDIKDYQNVDFDENNIALTFLAISDIHIDSRANNGAAKNYKRALENGYQLAKTGDIDLVFAAGDLVQNLMHEGDHLEEIAAFKKHTDDNLKDDTALVYCTGNHDRRGDTHYEKEFIEAFTATDADKQKYFRYDVEEPDVNTGNRHAVVNGYHFLSVGFNQDYVSYLKPRLDKITSDEPYKPVFVQYHYHAADTVYATKESNDGEIKLRELLDNYPQVVFFSGHSHNGLDNPRAIWQDTFTAIDTASVRYLDDNSLISWEFKIPINATHGEVFDYASEATLVEVDQNNNVRFTAFNTYRGDVVATYTIAAPNESKTHLLTYTDARQAYSMPPEFAPDARLMLTKNAGGVCKLIFDQATHDDIVWYYSIEFATEGENTIKKYLTSRYFDPNGMPDVLNATIAGLTVGKNYTITLTPYDVWNQPGKPIVKDYVA